MQMEDDLDSKVMSVSLSIWNESVSHFSFIHSFVRSLIFHSNSIIELKSFVAEIEDSTRMSTENFERMVGLNELL